MANTIQIKRGTGSSVPSSLAEGELAINLDSGKLFYGSGSSVLSDFKVDTLTAETYVVSSSVTHMTTSFSSGSTAFGDSAGDTHTFTGDITASGNISASANIYAADYFDNGANINTIYSPIASPTFTGTVAIPNIANVETAITANTAKATNVSTNLTATTHASQITINSSDGTNVIIAEASDTIAGVMSVAHHDKLDAIEASADITDTTNVTAAGALMDSELTDLAGVKGVTISTLQVKPSEGAFANGDKTKLDAIEASADVTDTANVTSAGALMDSELTDLAGVKGVTISTLQVKPSEGAFANGDKTKLDGIEASADVTDTTNVTSAGALMDSEVTNLAQVKAFDSSDYATSAQGTKADSAQQPPSEGAFANGDKTKLDGIEASADVTDTANVTSAGALMDSELTDLAGVKGVTISTLQPKPSEGAFANGDKTKLDAIEASATADQTQADINGLAITTVGALGSGTIASGFGNIDNGTSTIDTGEITATSIKHSISGNNAGDYGPGAEILYGISSTSVTAGAIYTLRSGVWTLIDANFDNRVYNLCAVATIAAGNGNSGDGMIIKGCVTLASAYTAGSDAAGIPVYASETGGEATLTAPSDSGDLVRILGYSLGVSNKKMFFNPDSTYVEIA